MKSKGTIMSHFDPAVLKPDPVRRAQILPVLDAALDAVDPYMAMQMAVRLQENVLYVGERSYDLARYERILALAVGKAATPMAQALQALGLRLDRGLVITKYGHGPDAAHPLSAAWEVVEAGHPQPRGRRPPRGRAGPQRHGQRSLSHPHLWRRLCPVHPARVGPDISRFTTNNRFASLLRRYHRRNQHRA